ncbi:chemotaxis protein CheB [Cupriavidus pinatubonensis]|uniref:chemotaxis protein CheB n=1 Tax=Cupriavidus pinatubonensis TaxID=248026 RepID=UPI001125C9D7|nr:chemotaxis protein CheB [Cupriavidus pinatubonensis]TPQ38063.1 hypothetical protein C2U69_14890 [Cupriavidus pinatubonensis]
MTPHAACTANNPSGAAVGASAGGIGALHRLLESIAADVPYAMVVLQHLPPDHPSRLPELLGMWTRLPVLAALEGMHPEPNHIYVPAPGPRPH